MRERGRRPWQHPSAGINRIKFCGCDLSPDPAGHPVSEVRLAKSPYVLCVLLLLLLFLVLDDGTGGGRPAFDPGFLRARPVQGGHGVDLGDELGIWRPYRFWVE